MQLRPQGVLGIFQNGGSLFCGVTRHFEKYPERPGTLHRRVTRHFEKYPERPGDEVALHEGHQALFHWVRTVRCSVYSVYSSLKVEYSLFAYRKIPIISPTVYKPPGV